MAFFSSQQLKFLPSFCKASAGAFWPWEQNFSLRSHLKLLHFLDIYFFCTFQKLQLSSVPPGVESALSNAPSLSLLLGLIHPGSPLWKSHFSAFAVAEQRSVYGNSARGVGRGFIQLYPAAVDGPLLPQPAGIAIPGDLTQGFCISMDVWLLGATKRLISSEAIKTEDLQFITSSALLHFPLFCFHSSDYK